ncbi:MAG: HAMP domain-containing histidine kinase [Myxococcales bacterium]|nr:HAMP domain-containing histidine kinase [Myxococcales bacterium]MCB9644566.1 HAMP domain-containing histidine kinase [Myxococcales bacterium]
MSDGVSLGRGALLGHDERKTSAVINLLWLRRLRWAVLLGQVLLIVVTHGWLQIKLPLVCLLVVLWGSFCTNAALQFWKEPPQAWLTPLMGATVIFDLFSFTLLLAWTGGPTNPFSFFYLVYVALAILILPQRWGWSLSGIAVLGYASLFWGWEGSRAHHSIHSPHHMKLHLEGMWLAYAMTTVCIVWFVSRTKLALSAQAAKIRSLQSLQARNEKLAAIAALAGGAMHEMATPLATIALVAKELQHALAKKQEKLSLHEGPEQIEKMSHDQGEMQVLIEDTLLIREQVDLCHRILRELVHQAGDSLGEARQSVSLEALLQQATTEIAESSRIIREAKEEVLQQEIKVPIQAMARVLRGLMRNSLEATSSTQPINVRAHKKAGWLVLSVVDEGCGMRPEILKQVGEPFFTTKPAGQGHGLGLFLARTVAEHLGGTLHIESAVDQGTTVTLELPLFSEAKASQESLGGV